MDSSRKTAAVSLVVFDLDGTLVDSREDLANATNATLQAFGHAPLPRDEVSAMVGEGARVLLERAFRAHGVLPAGALQTFLGSYEQHLVDHTTLYPGVADLLALIASRGRAAVLTNKPQRPSDRLIEHFGLAPCFFRVIGGDGSVPRKPDPSGLVALMADADAPPASTLMVGDSWVDHETARRAGVRVCLARYGFGFDQIPADRLTGNEILIDRPEDLLNYL